MVGVIVVRRSSVDASMNESGLCSYLLVFDLIVDTILSAGKAVSNSGKDERCHVGKQMGII